MILCCLNSALEDQLHGSQLAPYLLLASKSLQTDLPPSRPRRRESVIDLLIQFSLYNHFLFSKFSFTTHLGLALKESPRDSRLSLKSGDWD